MSITFKDTKEFQPKDLQNLFLSVSWASADYPERLVVAMKNSSCVFSAWDGNKLIGLVNALDDSTMTAYIHYMLVDPVYQKTGIGKKLINLIKERYKDYINIVLISYNDQTGFYENCGFEIGKDETPMFIKKIDL